MKNMFDLVANNKFIRSSYSLIMVKSVKYVLFSKEASAKSLEFAFICVSECILLISMFYYRQDYFR